MANQPYQRVHSISTLGRFHLPWLTDGGVDYPDSLVRVLRPFKLAREQEAAGFFGAAYGEQKPIDPGLYKYTADRVAVLGGEAAKLGLVTITGAAPGIPHQAAYGASEKGGIVLGLAPVANESMHGDEILAGITHLAEADERIVKPWDWEPLSPYDAVLFLNVRHRTREMRFVQRDLVNLYCARIAFFADGDAGTMHEAAVARELGNRVIAVLRDSGGVSENLEEIASGYVRKRNGTIVLGHEDPVELAKLAFHAAEELHERRKGIDDTLDILLDQVYLAMIGKPFRGITQEQLETHANEIFSGVNS